MLSVKLAKPGKHFGHFDGFRMELEGVEYSSWFQKECFVEDQG
jgi:hypothetical protein